MTMFFEILKYESETCKEKKSSGYRLTFLIGLSCATFG